MVVIDGRLGHIIGAGSTYVLALVGIWVVYLRLGPEAKEVWRRHWNSDQARVGRWTFVPMGALGLVGFASFAGRPAPVWQFLALWVLGLGVGMAIVVRVWWTLYYRRRLPDDVHGFAQQGLDFMPSRRWLWSLVIAVMLGFVPMFIVGAATGLIGFEGR